jgi:hypothetical protein
MFVGVQPSFLSFMPDEAHATDFVELYLGMRKGQEHATHFGKREGGQEHATHFGKREGGQEHATHFGKSEESSFLSPCIYSPHKCAGVFGCWTKVVLIPLLGYLRLVSILILP